MDVRDAGPVWDMGPGTLPQTITSFVGRRTRPSDPKKKTVLKEQPSCTNINEHPSYTPEFLETSPLR